MKAFAAFVAGLLFAAGLGLSGMTQPAKVRAFLDVRGAWDASLMFVMAGAVAITFLLFPLVLRRSAPLLEATFQVPKASNIDTRLAVGAAVFGVGWGLSGYCPGPAVVALATLQPGALAFFVATVVAAFTVRLVERSRGPVDMAEID